MTKTLAAVAGLVIAFAPLGALAQTPQQAEAAHMHNVHMRHIHVHEVRAFHHAVQAKHVYVHEVRVHSVLAHRRRVLMHRAYTTGY